MRLLILIFSRVKCSGGKWKEATNIVISKPEEFPFQIRTFDDFADDKDCSGHSLWGHVDQFYQPHDLGKFKDRWLIKNHKDHNSEDLRLKDYKFKDRSSKNLRSNDLRLRNHKDRSSKDFRFTNHKFKIVPQKISDLKILDSNSKIVNMA